MAEKLEVQKYLLEHGIEKTVNDFSLIYKETGNLFLLKYNQIHADWSKQINHECRGIILEKDTYNIVCLSFFKFFNIGEGYVKPIDWDSAKYYEKLDGSIMTAYFYNNKWNVCTSGTIDAGSSANNGITTFQDLFWRSVVDTYGSVEKFTSQLFIGYFYMFELCTPENIVVTHHTEYKIYLLGVRDKISLQEKEIESMANSKFFLKARTFDLSSVDDMLAQFENMTWQEEGFVVCDKNFNRGKCKNPKYVAVHHTATGVSPYSIVNVIKTNEMDEFLAYFPSRKEEVDNLSTKWKAEEAKLTSLYNNVKDIEDKKDFALAVLDGSISKRYTGLMFAMRNNQIASIHEGMCRLDNGYWYNLFNPKFLQKT